MAPAPSGAGSDRAHVGTGEGPYLRKHLGSAEAGNTKDIPHSIRKQLERSGRIDRSTGDLTDKGQRTLDKVRNDT